MVSVSSSEHAADVSSAGRYDDLWSRTVVALRSASYHPQPVPAHGDPRWGLSVVVPIDGVVAQRLGCELRHLARLRNGGHIVYRPDSLHCTVRSLEGYQNHVAPAQVEEYVAQVRSAALSLAPLTLRLKGIGGSPAGLFARGYASPSLHELRLRLHRAAAVRGPLAVPSIDVQRVRNTAHVSLMVFRPPCRPEPALVGHVSDRTEVDYGELKVRELSLVAFEWTNGIIAVREFARVPTEC
jgi:hypothetical protein